MANKPKDFENKGGSGHSGISRRNIGRSNRQGGRFEPHTGKIHSRRVLLTGPGREDHYGIKMHEPTAECDICCHKSDLFAVGACLHPICMECGIRLRIIGKHENCPKCRAHIDWMRFVHYTGEWSLDNIDIRESFPNKDADRYKLIFENEYASKCFNSYLAHICPICKKKGESREFQTFALLNQHVYMVHQFLYCDICVENLDLLSHERRIYSQLDLQRHLEKGDMDDKSQKGHPQCLFCDKRFLDEEFRYKHLRKEHFFCQICDADGNSNFFYNEHADLIQHYKKKHVVCEEGECKHLGIAFRSDVELKLHKSTEHAAGRQTLNLDFHYDRGGVSNSGNVRGGGRRSIPVQRNVPRIGVIPNETSVELQRTSDPSAFTIVPSMQAQGIDVSLRYSRAPTFNMQGNDFPRLGSDLNRENRKPEKINKRGTVLHLSAGKKAKDNHEKTANNSSATTSWFIDDDEAFGTTSRSTVIPTPENNSVTEYSVKSTLEDYHSKRPSYVSAFLHPGSLSNVAASFTSDVFPKLGTANPQGLTASDSSLKNLPADSAWRHNTLQFLEEPQIVECTVPKEQVQRNLPSSGIPEGGPNFSRLKKLPIPDIWPQHNVCSTSKERISRESDEKIKDLADLRPLIVKSEIQSKKKKKKKKEKTKSQLQKDQSSKTEEDVKASKMTDTCLVTEDWNSTDNKTAMDSTQKDSDELPILSGSLSNALSNNDSGVTLSSIGRQTEISNSKKEDYSLESNVSPLNPEVAPPNTSSRFSDVVSSTFNSLLNGFSKFTFSNIGSPLNTTSSDESPSTSLDAKTKVEIPVPESNLSPPPGLISMRPPGLPPPPGFGPPPGFESPTSFNVT